MEKKNGKALIIGIVIISCLTATTIAFSNQEADPSSPPMQTGSGPKDDPIARMTDIHDIKPLESIGFDFGRLRILWWCVAVVVLAAVVTFAVILFRKYVKRKKEALPPAPPHAVALERLHALAGLDRIGCREFYFTLSFILRKYIQGRYGLDALEMTTEELIPKIMQLNLDRNLERGIKDFLNWSDPVKFAGITSDNDKMRADLNFAEHFVNRTIPVEAETSTS